MYNMMRKLTSAATAKSNVSNREKIYSGYLFKKGSMNKKFQKRYFVIFAGKILAYFQNDKDTQHKGEINLSHVLSVNESDMKIEDESVYKHVFQVTTPDRVYILSAPDIKARNCWMDFIRASVFGTTIHQDWMTKQGDFVKSWKRRYFVLTSTKLLRYFEDEEQLKFKGIINVQSIQSIKEGDPIEPYWNFIIHLQTPDRRWLLNADSEAKRQQWLKMLDQGQKTIDHDKNAHLFVDIIQNNDKTRQRIKYIFDLYREWCVGHNQFQHKSENNSKNTNGIEPPSTGFKKSFAEIVNNDLKDYSNVQLLNDFNFVLETCLNDRQSFLELYRFLTKDKSKSAIPPNESLLLMRNMRDRLFYRDNNKQRTMLFNDSTDIKEINTQCLLDRIYSYIMYSYHLFYLETVEWARIKDYDETDKLITANKMLHSKRQWIDNAKSIFRINERHKKFMINVKTESKVSEKKEEKESETVEIPSNFNRLAVNFKSDENRESEYFEFGTAQFQYWGESKDNEWYVPKQYSNLKEEMTTNALYSLSMEQWNDTYESASNISESNKTSEFLSYDWIEDNNTDTQAMVDTYGIYEYTPMKINHICSILLCCNYYQLQQILMSTYARNLDINESIQDWKLRHGQFHHWAKLLRECCQVFGKLITDKDIFYYSINSDQIDFGKSLKQNYNVPMSMTKDLFVCQSYFEFDTGNDSNKGDKSGMLLSVTKQPNYQSFYIDCGWCSDFPIEQECLVLSIYPKNQCRIQSMVHISQSTSNNEMVFNNYQFYMSAISDLERMINGQKASDSIGRDTKIALNEMINERFGLKDKEEKEEKLQNEFIHVTNASINDRKPEIMISITTELNEGDAKAKTEDTDTPTQPQKVRPKGTLKGRKQSPKKANESNEIVFKLKAKRKKQIPEYIKTMFEENCMRVKRAHIDLSLMVSMKDGYRAWKEIFMNDTDTWFKLDVLVKLFPNLSEIRIDFIAQALAFTKPTVKALIDCLNDPCMNGREIKICLYRPNTYSSNDTEDFSLQTALEKYLSKPSKVGNNFNWFCRLNESGDIPCIEIMRPHLAMERNTSLSNILNEKQINIVMQILQKQLSKNSTVSETWYLNRLYWGKEHKFDASEFHKKCDGIPHTISVVKSTNDFIFGAYTSMPWGRTGKWVMDEFAFLIQIQSNDSNGFEPKVISVKKGHEQYGMYLQSNGGPGFGKGDIKILNKADKSSNNTCNSNSFSFQTKPNELVGGKGSYFKVSDYEVLQIAFY